MGMEKEIIDLYRTVATSLPEDVEKALEKAKSGEENPVSIEVLERILENVKKAREGSIPICQDTGIPIFYVKLPNDQNREDIINAIKNATKTATKDIPLRPNAVDTLTDNNIGNEPIIHFEESDKFGMNIMLKGGGSENVSAIYQLPDKRLDAGRDMEGVRKCILDAVFKAQGKGCPPYTIGVAMGGNIEQVASLSKKQLLRAIDDQNDNPKMRDFEEQTLEEINRLGIGPLGMGGKTTAIGVKIASSVRHPASFFVGISFGCWCMRRGKI